MAAEPQSEPQIGPSERKLRGLVKLRSLPAKLSDGVDYNLEQHLIAGVTLERVRQELSGIAGSLADAVVAERAR